MKICPTELNGLGAALTASPFCPQRTIFSKVVE